MPRHFLATVLLLASLATSSVIAVTDDVEPPCETSDDETCLAPIVATINAAADWKPVCARNVVIPHGVTRIPLDAYNSCDLMTSIVIPDSVTSIGKWAFYKCTSLASVVIPNSVTMIPNAAFYFAAELLFVEP